MTYPAYSIPGYIVHKCTPAEIWGTCTSKFQIRYISDGAEAVAEGAAKFFVWFHFSPKLHPTDLIYVRKNTDLVLRSYMYVLFGKTVLKHRPYPNDITIGIHCSQRIKHIYAFTFIRKMMQEREPSAELKLN